MIGIDQKLRQLRKDRNYTYRKLAQVTGISSCFICDIEHGRSNPSLETLYKFALAFNVSPKTLFEGGEEI